MTGNVPLYSTEEVSATGFNIHDVADWTEYGLTVDERRSTSEGSTDTAKQHIHKLIDTFRSSKKQLWSILFFLLLKNPQNLFTVYRQIQERQIDCSKYIMCPHLILLCIIL